MKRFSIAAMCVGNEDPSDSTVETQPQLEPPLLRLWAMLFQLLHAMRYSLFALRNAPLLILPTHFMIRFYNLTI